VAAAFVDIRGLTFAYPHGPEVLRALDLRLEAGVFAVLLGANGSGKSTLARHVNALLLPTAGSVHTFGLDTRRPENVFAIRSRVGMVFQVPDNQIVATTVEDDVAFGVENLGLAPDEIARRVDAALAATRLTALRHRPPHLLSGGQKQALALAGALAMGQEALVLDEATSMLDGEGRAQFLSLVRQLHSRGASVLAVTHRMEEAALADVVHVLAQGRIVLSGPPRTVFAEGDALAQARLVPPDVTEMAARIHRLVPAVPAGALDVDELVAALAPALRAARRRTFAPAAPVPAGAPAPTEAAAAPAPAAPAEPAPIVGEGVRHLYLRGTPLAAVGLEHADIAVRRGEALAVVGATGSGKSTLMQHLNGILRPDGGRLVAFGVDLTARRPDVWTVREHVGLLFQQPEDQLFEQLVGDDVAYGPFQMGLALGEVRERVRWAMEMAGLDFEVLKDRPVFALSAGQKRRVALAGVLALRPEILVLDEPLAGLDPLGARDLIERLGRLKAEAGVGIVFVTHHLDEVFALADRVLVLRAGRTIAVHPTEELMAAPALAAGYGLALPGFAQVLTALAQQGLVDTPVRARTPAAAAAVVLARLGVAADGPAGAPAGAGGAVTGASLDGGPDPDGGPETGAGARGRGGGRR
jgi:energy-coupling factor transporter ATPase